MKKKWRAISLVLVLVIVLAVLALPLPPRMSIEGEGFLSIGIARAASNPPLPPINQPLYNGSPLTLQPSDKDTYLDQYNPTTNQGSNVLLQLRDQSDRKNRPTLEFDISTLPEDATVDTATLYLNYYNHSTIDPSGRTSWIYKVTRNDWVELEATWNIYKAANNWTSAGGDYVTTDPAGGSANIPAGYGWVTWDVTDIVIDAIDVEGWNVVEFLLKFADETKSSSTSAIARFHSNDYTDDTSLCPKLVIAYTEPAVPEIEVSPTFYDFGVVFAGSTPSTATDEFAITNTSTMETDQTISVTTNVWDGGVDWTHSDTATPDTDQAGLLATVDGTSSKYEYYDSGDANEVGFYQQYWPAQTFTSNTSHYLTGVKLKLYREGSPGTATVSIRPTDMNGHPTGTGTDLCIGTTDADTLTDNTTGEWREIILGDGCYIASDTKYAIVVRALEGDADNLLFWRRDYADPAYAGGCYEWSFSSGDTEPPHYWTTYEHSDFMFEEWGQPVIIVKYTDPDYIYEDCPIATGYDFGLTLIAPTECTDGEEKEIKVRITAAVSV